jgi:cytochrome c55X
MQIAAPKRRAAGFRDAGGAAQGAQVSEHHQHKRLLIMAAIGFTFVAPAAPAIEPARKAELTYLLDQDCGSCHGMTRKGGLGPALLPKNLEGKPNELLIATILEGRPGTAMPPWRGQLTEAEAAWLVEQLRHGAE